MNNTLKILALATIMVVVSACTPGNTLSENEFTVEKTKKNGFDVLKFTCKADKPIMIKSISVNGLEPSFPHHDAPMSPQYAIAFSINKNVFRWQKDSWFTENNQQPIVYSCPKGTWDIFVDASGSVGYNDIVEFTVETESHGTNSFSW
jgi:hypothetical protein